MNLYQQKYLKYKTKYELLKKQIGGNKRIVKEIERLHRSPIWGITAVIPDESNIYIVDGTIVGPAGTPYEGYKWKVRMNFPTDYGFKAPTVTFVDRIFHPNISYTSGEVCVDILKEGWNPGLNIGGILLSIQSMFIDANPHSPLNWDAAILYRDNREEFNRKARQDAETYATLVPPPI